MKNILLIGDSIRQGYDKAVKEALEGKATVYFHEENSGDISMVLRSLPDYSCSLKFENSDIDIIHWNAGLWDCVHRCGEEAHTPLEIYRYYVERVCIRMKKLFPKATVIFATSTSVISEKMSPDFKRYNEEIEEYNRVAVETVSSHGFLVNDLYGVSRNLPEESHSDAVHYYTSMGTEAFSKKVLEMLVPLCE